MKTEKLTSQHNNYGIKGGMDADPLPMARTSNPKGPEDDELDDPCF